ncbi:MAG: hypothetical protein HRT72_03425 [Flavobacteriales bacterium]|nr:hypothetical protein [Flavobacteriales bacterium]
MNKNISSRVKKALCGIVMLSLSGSIGAQSMSYDEDVIVDKISGISVYDGLNALTGGDSVRNHEGYAYEGWVEDFYSSGELLHKGYYENGQLKIYKNFYKNGDIERNFKSFDDVRSSLTIYFQKDIIKTDVLFKYGYQFKKDEFLNDENHTLVYQEEYHKSSDYFLLKRSYYESGTLKASFELINTKKKVFSDLAYYETGNKKLDGKHKYDDNLFDYVKIGKWTFFNSKGDASKEQIYVNGQLDEEKIY